MDALDRLEAIAKSRGWSILLEYQADRDMWRMNFGPHGEPNRVHHVQTPVIDDCAPLMLNYIITAGVLAMAEGKV